MSEFAIKLERALSLLPLTRLMEQYGDSPKSGGGWKSFHCPFCGKKGAGVKAARRGRGEIFKCFHTSCPSGTSGDKAAWDAVGYYAFKHGMSDRTEAAIAYMKEAGVWADAVRAPSVMPGAHRKVKLPQGAYSSAQSSVASAQSNDLPGDPALPPPVADGSSAPGLEAGDAAAPGDDLCHQENPEPSESVWLDSGLPAVPGDEGEAIPPDVAEAFAAGDPAPPAANPSREGGRHEPVVRSIRERGLECLRAFYASLSLCDEDLEQLWRKRGLTVPVCERAGFRTNSESNYDLLCDLAQEFSEEELLESGLWQTRCARCGSSPAECRCREPDLRVGPNVQFHGFGMIGKKPKSERRHERDKTVWGWRREGKCNPILIPYFDDEGELVHLRPHKGGIEGRAPMLYVCRSAGRPEGASEAAVITEGEFKARALEQVLTHGGVSAAVAAIPGIQQAKNFEVMEQIKGWLESIGAKRVVIGYDNEEKGDPALPGYQPDPKQRHDATIWARYLAISLSYDWSAGVCTLPNAWRNASGKADWDGVLAARLREPVVGRGGVKEWEDWR